MTIPAKSLSLLASLISTATLGPTPLEVCLRPEDAEAFAPVFGTSPSTSLCEVPPAIVEQELGSPSRSANDDNNGGDEDNSEVVAAAKAEAFVDAAVEAASSKLDAAVLAVGHKTRLSERKRSHIEAVFRRLKPGGLMVLHFDADQYSTGDASKDEEDAKHGLPPLESLVDALNRPCFDDYYRGPLPNIEHQIKVALFLQDLLVLFKQGAGDEVDYLTLGDYGRAYGEGRGQLLGRLRVWELSAPSLPWDEKYFSQQLRLFDMHIEAVYARLTFKLKVMRTKDPGHQDYVLLTPRKKKKAKKMTIPQFRSTLINDLSFGLALHTERIEVTSLENLEEHDGLTEVEVKFLPSTVVPRDKVDFSFHPKIDWKNWTSYFRDQGPQPLHVVAQTFREKALMIGHDLSDFYKGGVTIGALQKKYQVTLQSPDCQSFDAAIKVHGFRCFPSSTGYTEQHEEPVPHSPLHRIFAKEKLDCCIGKGAFGDLPHRRVKHRWEGDEDILTQDGTMYLSGEKLIAYDRKEEMHAGWQASQRLDLMVTDKLNEAFGFTEYGTKTPPDYPKPLQDRAHALSRERSTDRPLGFVDDEECSTWVRERLWHMLKLGGLFAFEQDPCYGGFGSPVKYIATTNSSTGWARHAAGALLVGLEWEWDGIEMVFAHKNLIAARKAGGPIPKFTGFHDNPKAQRKHPPPRLEL
eukprot:CAMPEP_0206455184 /NCGR_PEP_ID=MMETSP0324_2-20121206/21600_1 /ASSEMBLY_ACC=CAM_ASM_000836 /TAXON_ID=2866 /ORGANISM="Crypthecodinium cohnii, Strain Seligo" /LENGTH=690 /DNA_ID=CAMNT_0053925837 /DNA_START=57 /DNA_END=2129 /DNA_ORIENTATION=-